MFGRTVTIFTKHNGSYYPRVFHDAQVARDRGYIQRVYGTTTNVTIAVHIKNRNGLAEGLYSVYEPRAWSLLQDLTNAVSFKAEDVIWLGDWATVDSTLAPIADNSKPGGFYSWLRSTYDLVFNLTQVSEYIELPHWEIAGR